MSNPTDVVGRRILQYLIDSTLAGAPGMVAFIAVWGLAWARALPGEVQNTLNLAVLPSAWLATLLWGLYVSTIRPVRKGTGQTFGMQLMKLKLLTEDGSPLTYRIALVRSLGLMVDGMFNGVVGVALAASDQYRHQALSNRMSKTLVVDAGFNGPLPVAPAPWGGWGMSEGATAA